MDELWMPSSVSENLWQSNKDKIYKLLDLSEQDIQKIWREDNEPELITKENFNEIEYHWNAPLYQKMIWRLRETFKVGRGFYFWNQIDLGNRQLLCNYFELYDEKPVSDILNMLIWYYNLRFFMTDQKFKDDFEDETKRKELLDEYESHLTEAKHKMNNY